MTKDSVMFLCDGFRAPYGGNFIPSLLCLENKLSQKYRCIYVFQKGVEKKPWAQELISGGHTVETLDFDTSIFNRLSGVLKLIAKYNVLILHAHFGDKVLPSIIGWTKRNVKVIIHHHSDWSFGDRKTLSLAALSADLKNCAYKILSRKTVRLAVSEKIAEEKNAIYIPNGLATERIQIYDNDMKAAAREEAGISCEKKLLLMFAWAPKVKGADIAVQAVLNLKKSGADEVELAIVHGEDLAGTIQYIRTHTDYNDEEYIHFFPLIQDVFHYHNIADIMLSTSRSEGFPYTLMEAVSIRKPCVSSDIPGTAWANSFNSVEFFENKNVSDCQTAIQNVLNKLDRSDFKQELYIDSLRLIAEYNSDIWAKRIEEVYKKTVG